MEDDMRLTPAEFAASEIKIAKANARAAAKGYTGNVTITGTPVTVTEKGYAGLPVTQHFIDTEITGEPPCYEGWTFVARVEFDRDSGMVVYGAPGAEPVNRDQVRPSECDHCHTSRYRKYIYIVTRDGQQLQVGSTCISDFLGVNISPVWVSTDASDYAPDISGPRMEPVYDVDTVLAYAWAAIQAFGYYRTSDPYPTKYAVLDAIDPRDKKARETADAIRPHVGDAVAHAAKVRAWILSGEFTGNSDFVSNLKGICKGEFVKIKNFGFLVYAPMAWSRAQEKEVQRKQEQDELLNEWNGAVGDKLTVTVTLKSIRPIPGEWGTTDLYTFTGDDKRVYKWFSSRTIWTEVNDEQIVITGTVKELDEYKGKKSTVLTRCKIR
jgi:hypothetical protein